MKNGTGLLVCGEGHRGAFASRITMLTKSRLARHSVLSEDGESLPLPTEMCVLGAKPERELGEYSQALPKMRASFREP